MDILPEDRLDQTVGEMIADEATHQIILIRFWDIVRAKFDREYARCLRQSSLVIPVSGGVVRSARFLRRQTPVRYMPFEFVVRVLGALESRHRSVYLLGGQKSHLHHIEQNLRHTFPGLRLVGRYTGFYDANVEKDIITAIRKSSPDLLLSGTGIRGNDKWYYRHRNQLQPGMALWSGECFDMFSERRRKPSRRSYQMGMDFLPELFRRPWRVLRGFVYLFYGIVLLIHRIRKI